MPIRVRGYPGSNQTLRKRLSGPTNFYVRPGGNDFFHNGLVNTDAGAFATPQGAYNYIKRNIDCNGNRPSVYISAGTYPPLACSGALVGEGPNPSIEFIGDLVSSPPSVVFSTTSNTVVIDRAAVRFSGIYFTNTNGSNLTVQNYGHAFVGNCEWGPTQGEVWEAHNMGTITAEGPVTFSGNGNDLWHYTDGSQIVFTDQTITFLDGSTRLLGTRITGPKFTNYIAGGNRADCDLSRANILGSCSGDVSHLSRMFVHIGAMLNLSSATGVEGLFPGQSPPQIETNGHIVYDPADCAVIYFRTDANGNNADGYANNVTRAFKDIAPALAYLAERPPDQAFPTIPIVQFVGGYTGGINCVNIPGVAEVILLGDETTPANVTISTTGSNCFQSLIGVSTIYHIRGFKMTSTLNSCLFASEGGNLRYQNCEFAGNAAAPAISVGPGSSIYSTGAAKCTAASPQFIRALNGGVVEITHTIEFINNFAWGSQGVLVDSGSIVRWSGTKTKTGTITGNRTLVKRGGLLNIEGAAQNTLPGSVDVAADGATFGQII